MPLTKQLELREQSNEPGGAYVITDVGGLAEPPRLAAARRAADRLDFTMSCSDQTGQVVAFLASVKPGSRILELGTGVGHGTIWLTSGMGPDAALTTIEIDHRCLTAARTTVGPDERITWVQGDAGQWLVEHPDRRFDLLFADCWPGKFTHLDDALALLADDGIYVVDDLNPQPNWPPDHQGRVDSLLGALNSRPDLHILTLPVATGVLLATRHGFSDSNPPCIPRR
jgi:predicted O-methyltransferase YrrM